MCGITAYIGEQSLILFNDYLKKIKHRGPDDTKIINIINKKYIHLGFQRLSINDLSLNGMQPMIMNNVHVICNGEIYNYKKLKKDNNFEFKSSSDCEIILHMYLKYGIEHTIKNLHGVFAFVLYDFNNNVCHIGRDIIGIRPLFIGYDNNSIMFSSEVKSFPNNYKTIEQFKQSSYSSINLDTYNYEPLIYNEYFNWNIISNTQLNEQLIYSHIKHQLTNAVHMRLMSDRPVGCFLSGGLDSSIITSIMCRKLNTQLTTFSIGMKDSNAPDLKYGQIVADYLKTNHHTVYYTFDEGFNALSDLIYTLETYDITTIRASLPQYMLSKYVKENTDIKVLLSGEGPDEHFGGYQYMKMAPSDGEFQKEAHSLTRNLPYFDVLRTDRTTANSGLEVRVPFLDANFVKFSLSIPAKYKRSNKRMEKYIIRKAFEDEENPYLPHEILWRPKNAFSDAVGYQWVDRIKEKVESMYTNEEFEQLSAKYTHNKPISKEALYYRTLFEKHFPNRDSLIPKYWMPNEEWQEEKLDDPSALRLKCFTE